MNLYKTTKKTRLSIAGLALIALLSGCEYDYIQPDNAPITTEVKFSSDIIPIFETSCNMSGCHSAGATPPDLSPANAYTDLFQTAMIDTITPTNSVLYTSMHSGSMKKYSTPTQTQTILAWIEQGAKNN